MQVNAVQDIFDDGVDDYGEKDGVLEAKDKLNRRPLGDGRLEGVAYESSIHGRQ